jgi:hypothetical protein
MCVFYVRESLRASQNGGAWPSTNDAAPNPLNRLRLDVGVRLTEFSFCGEQSFHTVYAFTAKTEFCKPDPIFDVNLC